MSEQVALLGFEKPNEKELRLFEEILPALQAAALEMGGNESTVYFKAAKSYSSVYCNNTLAFRIKLRGKSNYVEVPKSSKACVVGLTSEDRQKAAGDFWRVAIDPAEKDTLTASLASVIRDVINKLPKEWDCCSRYLECSNAKKCVHPDPSFALGCGYRKILNSGKIYYGENRNI